MKCVQCDNHKSLKKRATTLKYKQCGLDNVTLRGVEYFKCDQCGEEYFGFGDQEQLHALIAHVLLQKKGLLIGKEIRFLRTYLGYSSGIFAKLAGYTKETLSRFENGKVPISKTLNILIRALVATKLPDRRYDFHDLLLHHAGESHQQRIELDARSGDWRLKQAA